MKNFLLELDLSQVESRIVYMLTRDESLIKEARALPWEYDMHTENAREIFKLPPQAPVTKEQRYLGKRTVHAAQRGMRGKTMSEHMLKDGFVLTPTQCEVFIDSYFSAKRPVQDIYFFETGMTVRRDRKLRNSWGREIEWKYDRFSDDLYREAYSWVPQSEAAELLNQWGLIPAFRFLKGRETKLCGQIHDALLLETNYKEAYAVANHIRSSLERPRIYSDGNELVVPVSMKIGRTWKGDHEFVKFPEFDEFHTKLSELELI